MTYSIIFRLALIMGLVEAVAYLGHGGGTNNAIESFTLGVVGVIAFIAAARVLFKPWTKTYDLLPLVVFGVLFLPAFWAVVLTAFDYFQPHDFLSILAIVFVTTALTAEVFRRIFAVTHKYLEMPKRAHLTRAKSIHPGMVFVLAIYETFFGFGQMQLSYFGSVQMPMWFVFGALATLIAGSCMMGYEKFAGPQKWIRF